MFAALLLFKPNSECLGHTPIELLQVKEIQTEASNMEKLFRPTEHVAELVTL